MHAATANHLYTDSVTNIKTELYAGYFIRNSHVNGFLDYGVGRRLSKSLSGDEGAQTIYWFLLPLLTLDYQIPSRMGDTMLRLR